MMCYYLNVHFQGQKVNHTRRTRHAHKSSIVADGFEHETSARKFNICVGFEVRNGGDCEGRCVLGCGVL